MTLYISAYLPIVTPRRFQEKRFYVKQTTFSTAYWTKNETKPIHNPKITLKINMRSLERVLEILLMSAVIYI